MKRYLAIFLILLTLFTGCAFAAKSPTVKEKIYSEPTIPYTTIEDLDILEQIDVEELEGYILYDAIEIELKEKYELVNWHLPVKFIAAKVVIFGESVYVQECPINEDGSIVVDFSELEPSIYYLFFYIKQE